MSSNNVSLSPLTIPRHNRSVSSLNSEAATFHSAQAVPQIEMPQTKPTSRHSHNRSSSNATATKMSRTDSGYEPGESPTRERRSTSTSSSRSRRTGRLRSLNSSTTTRPSTKRASRSLQSTSNVHRSGRPPLQSRYTSPRQGATQPQAPYTFFQFPSLAPESVSIPQDTSLPPSHAQNNSQAEPQSTAPQSPPPATISYFLLPETRRLEYAAIDAASRGVRGFMVRIIPDCILPAEFRRRRLHDPEAEDSDCGSVRRYRLCLEGEEKSVERNNGKFDGRSLGTGSQGRGDQERGKWEGWWGRLLRLGKR
jgi:hypothetical protein